MKLRKLGEVERFLRRELPTKLRTDLKKLRITKEGDIECCIYYHLRRKLPADGLWTILARKFSVRTGYYIDLLLLRKKCPRLAVEIKWNQKKMKDKDFNSLMSALKELRVNKAYFVSVGPDVSEESYEKFPKKDSQKYRLHEIRVGLEEPPRSAKRTIQKWKESRHLLGKNMRLGKASLKKAWLNT